MAGSGPSGVHFARTLVDKGYAVTLIDVGHDRPPPVRPELSLTELKTHLDDPVAYFLGEDFHGALLPAFDREYYGIPPSKDYVFEGIPDMMVENRGFEPLFSFARGGLAEAWTAGCYPFNAGELADFPFPYDELAPHYGEVARRIGITGTTDDLARFLPVHDHLLEPLPLDEHSAILMARYQRHRRYLQHQLGCHLGRTRVATLPSDRDGRRGCTNLGRCLWGCPHQALYTPSQTLRELLDHPRFSYRPGYRVEWFRSAPDGTVQELVMTELATGTRTSEPVDTLILATGALSSTRIYLRSILEATGERVSLAGLMDNRQILLPFINLRLIGRPFTAESYQYHLLGLGIDTGDPHTYVHGQITTLKTAMLHPIIQKLPLDLRTAVFVTRNLHSALGVVNLNFHDTRRPGSSVTLADGEREAPRLVIRYRPPDDEPARLRTAIRTSKRALRRLGCIVPPGMMHVRPMGASVHYAGTIPMTADPDGSPDTTDALGRSRRFPNVILADGATFPFLPAKNITFTLMANATRIANAAF